MEGTITAGWFTHPSLGTIKIFRSSTNQWVYQCYSQNGSKALSKERELDQWTWVMCEKLEDMES